MAKFTRVGIAFNIVNFDNFSQSFVFSPATSFTFSTVSFDTDTGSASFPIEFFGLTESDKYELLRHFLMQEHYLN